MAQFVIVSDGSILSNILGGCIYGACKDTKITGNVTDGILAGCVYGACKNVEITGQPTPNTGTLIVTKVCRPVQETLRYPRNEERILKIQADIRENVKLLSELSLGTPIISAIKAKLEQKQKEELAKAV